MLLSLILAWIAVLLAGMTTLKYVARISKNPALNRFFRKIHIPFGVLLLIVSLLHGLLAGNAPTATLANFQLGAVLFTLNWGTACLVVMLGLLVSYLLRKKWRRQWMPVHRLLTLAMVLLLVLHVLDLGIQLPGRLAQTTSADTETAAAQTQTQADSDVAPQTENQDAGLVRFSGAQLKDGIYQGAGDGYKGTITVKVTVSAGQVTKIDVENQQDTPRFFSQAQTVLQDIMDQQSLQVDAVSGATFSSAGLINAVYDALQEAVTSGTLEVANIEISSVKHH